MLHDYYCMRVTRQTPALLISWWLMSNYAYRIDADPIISDNCYDELCRILLEKFDDLEHPHKHLVTKEDLACGSDFGVAFEDMYPSRVSMAVRSVRQKRTKK